MREKRASEQRDMRTFQSHVAHEHIHIINNNMLYEPYVSDFNILYESMLVVLKCYTSLMLVVLIYYTNLC